MVARAKERASGLTAASEEATAEAAKMTEPIEAAVMPEERERKFRTPGFSRMRFDWSPEDRVVVSMAQRSVEERVLANFADAYQTMYEVYDLVRTPVTDEAGEPRKDEYGFTIWRRSPSGSYDEDWTKLSLKEKERFLFEITTRMFEWEQRAADAWGESMFAKAQWEERFAIAFDAPMAGTVDDRRAAGNKDATEERYFAIFVTLYSRKADAIVRSLALLGQRLKDSMA